MKPTISSREQALLSLQRRPRQAAGLAVDFGLPRPVDIESGLSKDELYRVAYMPYVVAEVVWDYADTLCDLAAAMRLDALKPLCRAIKELRRDYDRSRAAYIDQAQRQVEAEHMLMFQREFKASFSKLRLAARLAVSRAHGPLDPDSEMLATACCMASICYRALRKYAGWADALIESKCGPAYHSILPDQMRRLGSLLPLFAGDCGINVDTPELTAWRDALCAHIHSIQFTGDIEVANASTN